MPKLDMLQSVPVTSAVQETSADMFKAALSGTSSDNYNSVLAQELEALFAAEGDDHEETVPGEISVDADSAILVLCERIDELQQQLAKYQELEKKAEAV